MTGLRAAMLILTCMTFRVNNLIPFNPNMPCEASKYCSDQYCVSLDSLAQLDFCNCRTVRNTTLDGLILFFQDGTVLNPSSTDGLLKLLDCVNSSNFFLGFENLKGIDLGFLAALRLSEKSLDSYGLKVWYLFYYSAFSLFHNNAFLSTQEKCTSQLYSPLINVKSGRNVLDKLLFLGFRSSNRQDKICKHMFHNLSLYTLEISRTSFEFLHGPDESVALNFSLMELNIKEVYNIDLNTKTLDPDLFQQTLQLNVYESILTSIQEDLFKDRFHLLKNINLRILNTKVFLHSPGGVAWIQYLNYQTPTFKLDNLSTTESALLSDKFQNFGFVVKFISNIRFTPYSLFYPMYTFPDYDFCLFVDVPFQRLVFIIPDFESMEYTYEPNLTCTRAWLARYQFLFSEADKLDDLDQKIEECDFKHMVASCQFFNKSAIYIYDQYIIMYNLGNMLNMAQHVLVEYTRPVACGLAFVVNMTICLTIAYNYKRKQQIRSQKDQEIVLLEQPLYKYILLNSIFNSIYSMTYFLDSFVLFKLTKPFDSYEYRKQDNKNKTIAINMIGSMVKLMSNFSLLQISINRYLLVGKDHSKWIVNISEMKVKHFLILSILLSMVLSLVVYYQLCFYSYHETMVDFNTFLEGSDGFGYEHNIDDIVLINIFTIIHDLFSNFLFCILLWVMDTLTVKKLHDALKEKKKITKKELQRKMKQSERRSIMMVVANSLVRIPEILITILYYLVEAQGTVVYVSLCLTYSNCTLFIDFANVFYTLSLSFYLLFYVKFNKMFNVSFKFMFQTILVRLKCKKKQIPVSDPPKSLEDGNQLSNRTA